MIPLEKVLEQLIVPRYEKLESVSVDPMGLSQDWFKIVYYFNPPLDHEDAIEIMEETSNLYKMMGEKEGDIIVSFEKVEEDID